MKWLLVGLIAFCNTLGDVLNSAGMKRHGRVEDFRPEGILRLIGALSCNRFVLSGIAVMVVSFFALLALLSLENLSFAIPATAASYLFETALAKYVLKERIGWKRWAGASLVAFGVMLLSF